MEQPHVQLLHETFFDLSPAAQSTDPIKQVGRAKLRETIDFRQLRDEVLEAGALQREMCPGALPTADGIRIFARSRSKGIVGGDLFDVFRVSEDQIGFWIVDATGHSIASGLLAAVARGALGTYRRIASKMGAFDPVTALELLNGEILAHEFSDCSFVAAICGVFDERTREIRWVRAGAPRPLVVRDNQRMARPSSEGVALGMIEDAGLQASSYHLQSGDSISFFSDGVEELPIDWPAVSRTAANGRNSDYWDFDRCTKSESGLCAILDGAFDVTQGHDLSDDFTIVTFVADKG